MRADRGGGGLLFLVELGPLPGRGEMVSAGTATRSV